MFLILISGSVVAIGIGVFLAWIAQRYEELGVALCGAGATIAFVIALIMLVIIPIYAFEYEKATYQAKVLNREYETEYTIEEVMYAKNVIETVQYLNRSRLEIIRTTNQ